MVNDRSGRSRVAAGRLGTSGGWRLAAWLALEWLWVGCRIAQWRGEPRSIALDITMSWVSDIILLANSAECFNEDYVMLEVPTAIAGVNRWLEAGDWAPLVSLAERLTTEKAFQACAYGGALNRLDVPAFLNVVAEQPWKEKAGVMLLIRNEGETAFTPYRLSSTGSILKIM